MSERNAVGILMCIELMLNAVNLTPVTFSRYLVPGVILLTGQVFAIFVGVVAAAEVAIGLAIILTLYRRREAVDVERADLMKW